jgi:hypothetical protein
MPNRLEYVTYLIKVQHTVSINNIECCYDEIVAQCTDLGKAIILANSANGKIERHTEPINHICEESLEN